MRKNYSVQIFVIFNLIFSTMILIFNFTSLHSWISEMELKGHAYESTLKTYMHLSLFLESALIPFIINIFVVVYNANLNVTKILLRIIMYYWLILVLCGIALIIYGVSISIRQDLGVYTQLGAFGYVIIGLLFTTFCMLPFVNVVYFLKIKLLQRKEKSI